MYHIKNDKRSIQSSEWIYEALASLMQEKDYSKITVTEVVEKAGLGRTTFYRNYDSLDDVLKLKCEKVFQELYEYLLVYYRINKSSDGNNTVFIKPFLRFWYTKSLIIELLMISNRPDILKESFENMYKLFLPHIDKSHHIIWSHMDYFIAIRSGMAISILIQWIKNDKNIAPDTLADLIIKQMKESLNLNLLL